MQKKNGLFLLLLLLLPFSFLLGQAQWQEVGAQHEMDAWVYGSGASIVMSPNDVPYVLYEEYQNNLSVKKYVGGTWIQVGTPAFVSVYVSTYSHFKLVISKMGTPFVLCLNIYGDLTVMKYDGTAWVIVGASGLPTNYLGSYYTADIAVDGNDYPYVVYRDFAYAHKATVKKFNGTSWTTLGTTGFSAKLIKYPSIAVGGSNNTCYISYLDTTDNSPVVMKYNGSVWSSAAIPYSPISNGGNLPNYYMPYYYNGSYIPLVMDSTGNLFVGHLAWASANQANPPVNTFNAVVKKYNGATWTTMGTWGTSNVYSIMLSPNRLTNSFLIEYVESSSGSNYDIGNGAVNINSTGKRGIQIASNGTLFGLGYQQTSAVSIYTYIGGAWQSLMPTSSGIGFNAHNPYNPATYLSLDSHPKVSIAVGDKGIPYVSHSTNPFIKTFDGNNWNTISLPLGSVTGTNVEVDSGNVPYILAQNVYTNGSGYSNFYKYANGSLVALPPIAVRADEYAMCVDNTTGGVDYAFAPTYSAYTGSLLTLNTASVMGTKTGFSYGYYYSGSTNFSYLDPGYLDIARSNAGHIYVVYKDAVHGDKATVKNNGYSTSSSWPTVGPAGFSAGAVSYTSIAIDANNVPYVSYTDNAYGGKATVKKFNGTAWVDVGTPGFSAGKATHIDMVIDDSLTPYVVFGDGANGDKATAMKFDGTNWVVLGTAGFSVDKAYSTDIALDNKHKKLYIAYSTPYNTYVRSIEFAPTLGISVNATMPVCVGTNLVYTALPVNSDPNTSVTNYQWKKNGQNIGTNSSTLSLVAGTSVLAGDVIACTMSYAGYLTGTAVSTNTITTSLLPPSQAVTIVHNQGTATCAGTITFSLNWNPGPSTGNYLFEWKKNSTIVSTNSTYIANALAVGDSIKCKITSPYICQTPNPFLATTYISTIFTPTITISTNNATVCNSAAVTFTAATTNAGTSPSYQWKVNDTLVATTSVANYTFPVFNYATNSIVSCDLISNVCASAATVSSNSLTMNVLSLPPVCVSISTPNTIVCNGQTTVFTATLSNACIYPNAVYQWKKNGVNIGTNSSTLNLLSLSNTPISDTITCTFSYSGAISGSCTSNQKVIYVLLPQTAVITSSTGSFSCSGTTSTFYATFTPNIPWYYYTNVSYQYEWRKNNIIVSTGGNYTTNTVVNGDSITCKITSTSPCQIPATFYATPYIAQIGTAVISISTPNTTVCDNVPVSFTATSTNVGNNVSYKWKVNGGLVATTSVPTYTFPNLSSSGVVTCELYYTCATPAVSNGISMTVNSSGGGYISISSSVSGNSACSGLPVTFTANASMSPIYVNPTLQWRKNGTNIAGATGTTYTTSTLTNYDTISCNIITNNSCRPIMSSNKLIMSVVGTNSLAVPTITLYNVSYNYPFSTYPITAGATATFKAKTTFEGTAPVYQWKVNGVNMGTNSPNFSYTPSNNQVVTCELTSNAACAVNTPVVSDPVTMLVRSSTWAYFASYPKEVCDGDTIYYESFADLVGYYCPDYMIEYYEWHQFSYAYVYPPHYGTTYTYNGGGLVWGSPNYEYFDSLNVYFTYPSYSNCTNHQVLNASVIGGGTIRHSVNFSPTISIASNGAGQCAGNSIIFTANTTGEGKNAHYQWKVNGVAIPDAKLKSFASATLNTGDVVTCDLFSSLSCASPAVVTSSPITVYIGLPTLTTSTPTICVGGTAQLAISGGMTGATYSWQYFNTTTSTWTAISGYTNTTNTSYSVALTAARSFRIIYTASCGTVSSATIDVIVNPDPTLTVATSATNFCLGTSTPVLTATLTGGVGTSAYQWQELIGGVYTNIAGATSLSYSPTITTSGTKYYKCVPTLSGSGCGLIGNGIVTVVVNALPNVITTPAAPAFCTGGSVSIAASGGTGTTFSWSPATNLSATTGTPVVANPAASTTYSLTGTGTNGCSKTISVPVTVNPAPSISIMGSNTVCSGSNVTFMATNTGGAGTCTVVWQKSTNGTTWANIAGATGAVYTSAVITAATYYRCTYSCNGSACTPAAVSNSILVNLVSVTPITTILSSTTPTICMGGAANLSINTGLSGTIYTWQESANGGNTWSNMSGYIGTSTTTYTSSPLNASMSYRVIGTSSCKTDTSNVVNVSVIPDPTMNVTASSTSICDGANVMLSATQSGGVGTGTYQWQEQISGLYTNIVGATSASYTSPALSTGNKKYKMVMTMLGLGCNAVGVDTASIIVNPLPTISIAPINASYCLGDMVSLTASGAVSYSWTPSTYLNALTGANVIASPTTSITYSVTGIDANGCANTASVPVIINLISLSTSTPSICTGGTAQLSITGGMAGSTYSWQAFNTSSNSWLAINLPGYTGGTNTSFSPTLVASQQYRVIYTTPCGSGTTPVVNITVIPDPTVTITSSSTNLCVGTNTTLTATLNGGTGTATYQWQENVGGVYNTIPGATSNVYTTAALSTSGNKYYKVIPTMTGTGCNLSGTGIVSLAVKALPNIAISPTSPTYCVGGSISIAASGGTSYSWSPATNLSATTGTPVVANPTSSTTYTLTGTASNGCSKTINVPVTVNPDPSISISGNNTACVGGTTTFTAIGTGGAGTCTIVWQKSANGTTWTNIAGATGATYTTPALSANAYYRATYSCNGGGCSPAAVSNSINVTLLSPIATVLSTTNPTICTGGTASLSVNTGLAGTTYSWQQSTNGGTSWTNISGYLGTINSSYTSAALTTSTAYRVIGISACKRDTTAALTITVVPDPALTVSTSGNNFCIGNNPVLTANLTNGTGTATYQWQQSISGVYTNIAGATNATYTPNILTSGNNYYKVLASMSGAGCGVTGTGIISLTAKALPNVATSPASPNYCIGGSQSIAASGASTYAWSPATNLSATTGTPVVANPQATTSYTLTGTGTNGCTKTITVPVTVTADPSISISGPASIPTGTSATLTASVTGGSGTCTRQWQSSTNGTTWANISGATGASYTTPAITGTKYYRASYNCTASGCSPIAYSNTLAIIGVQPPARMEMPNNELSLSLFPNPADVKITVHLDMTKDANTDFAINNLLGEEVIKWQGQSENGSYEQEISIENLAAGVYFLTARIEGRTMIQKFVKE